MKLLLLAGTSEARRVAEQASGVTLIASLSGSTREPADLPCMTRTGGFGGAEGFARYLKKNGFDAVLDATHPFAARISRTVATVCATSNIPHAQLLRPGWTAQEGDRWTHLKSEADAAAVIPEGAVVFLGTGRQTLARYANLTGRELICRQIDPPNGPFPFPKGRFLVGRPPFSIEDEINLFTKLGVDWLVVKNSGGAASRSKLDAARELGLPVAMIARPEAPDCTQLASVEGALKWIETTGKQYDKSHH